MRNILFVDDEPKVLAGLRRMLRSLRSQWEMEFAEGGPQALDALAAADFDVVVTDMRMPGMDGSQLLREVMRRHPSTVRIILSGQCDRAVVLKAVEPTHQFLTKPCDADTLKSTVARACELRDRLTDDRYKELVSCITSVPSLPARYQELVAELESSEASIRRVSQIISQDVGMTAKIMQLVSTGFLGTPQRVSDPARAAGLLDLDTIRALLSTTGVFSPLTRSEAAEDHHLERLVEHSLAVAEAARRIAAAESEDATVQGDAYLAGFLHDVGVLVLARHAPQHYLDMRAAFHTANIPPWQAEKKHFNVTHADIGGYLGALWGLPAPIVEAAALHHYPSHSTDRAFSPLTAVHVANAVLGNGFTKVHGVNSRIDKTYLEQINLSHRLEAWMEICRSTNLAEVP